MAKIIVFTNLSLDGVMQAPGRPDEDRRDGFIHGGWAAPFAAMQEIGDDLANVGAVLFGRRTYEEFYAFWPRQAENRFTTYFNDIRKYVVSTTLPEPLPWQNSTLLSGDLEKNVGRLRKELEKDLVIFGSGVLIQSLMVHGLVDRYLLLIHPLVLGSGRRLFAEGGPYAALRLVASKTTASGVLIASYEPASADKKSA